MLSNSLISLGSSFHLLNNYSMSWWFLSCDIIQFSWLGLRLRQLWRIASPKKHVWKTNLILTFNFVCALINYGFLMTRHWVDGSWYLDFLPLTRKITGEHEDAWPYTWKYVTSNAHNRHPYLRSSVLEWQLQLSSFHTSKSVPALLIRSLWNVMASLVLNIFRTWTLLLRGWWKG